MRRRPNRRARRIWLSLAAIAGGLLLLTLLGWRMAQLRDTDLQDPTAGVTDQSEQAIPEHAPEFRFEDVAADLGVTAVLGPGERGRTLPEDTAAGLAWGDYDGDGDFDLYLVNFRSSSEVPAASASNRLFRNDGTVFVDSTLRAGVGDPDGFGMGATFVDYDGDSDLDFYVTNRGPNRLYSNNGDGTFEEIAAAAGVDDPLWSVGAVWGDLDRDGRLDLYVANYVDFDDSLATEPDVDDPNWTGVPVTLNPNAFDPQPNRFYRQGADGRFVDDALASGVSNPGGRSLGVALADFDGNGWLDLYVANDVSPNALFLNASTAPGEPIFEDGSASTGTADPRGSMGICVGDLGEDEASRLPTLFITHWVAQENALYQPVAGSTGRLEYRDRARQARLAEVSLDRVGWGCAAADFDADGRVDLIVANGSTLEEPTDRSRLIAQRLLLHWRDEERFVEMSSVSGTPFASKHVARGLGVADFDGDGDLDLAVARNRDTALLLRNDSSVGRALGVRLLGADTRTIGSRLELKTATGTRVAWWRGDASFASGHAPEQLFGLGELEGAESLCLEVDSRTRCYQDLRAGSTYVLAFGVD